MQESPLEAEDMKLCNKESMKRRSELIDGFKSGIPIAVGYIPIAAAFGLLAKSFNTPDYISIMMSLFVYAGASQFVGVNLMAMGAAPWEIIMTTFILNLRHFLMTASISQRMEKNIPRRWMSLLAYGITDETFSVASMSHKEKLHPHFLLGLNVTAFGAWNIGTWAGIFMAAGLPLSLKESMGIALYAMFIGLLVPALKRSRPVLVISIAAAGIHSLLEWASSISGLSTGWNIIIATVLAAALGAVLFPEGVNV